MLLYWTNKSEKCDFLAGFVKRNALEVNTAWFIGLSIAMYWTGPFNVEFNEIASCLFLVMGFFRRFSTRIFSIRRFFPSVFVLRFFSIGFCQVNLRKLGHIEPWFQWKSDDAKFLLFVNLNWNWSHWIAVHVCENCFVYWTTVNERLDLYVDAVSL